MLTIIEPDYASNAWEDLPGEVRSEVRDLLRLFRSAPQSGITKWLMTESKSHGIPFGTLKRKYYALDNNGGDWTQLVDKKKATAMRAEESLARSPRFAAELVRLAETYQRKSAPAIRELYRLWKARGTQIPGYEEWPGWPKIPAGWSKRNLTRIIKQETNQARMRSVRVGTSSKTNSFLPHVLTTRVGLWPGAVIQLDDVWHDDTVSLGKKKEIVRVLELGALDLFSANRFHWGAKPRRRRENGSWESIAGKDMRLFIAGMFHRFGYSPRGCMLMSEHNTAKVDEDIARILYDASGGKIRVDYQPIEGKQAALSGFWAGTEGGNFRAKACLESTHNLMHNDLASLPMQTGSPSSGLKGPVTTERIAAYAMRIMKDVLAKVPHRAHLIKLPTMDFHTQFIPFLVDYYHFGLNDRTDHNIEGWERLLHVITEYTALPGSDQFFDEETFLCLPEASQAIIRAASKQDPDKWSRRRNLSPNEVWNRRDKFLPIPPSVLCDILTDDLSREVKAERGFLTFSDREIAPDPLVYYARYCSGPNKGREIGHGETVKMFALPFDDATAIVVDAKDRFLGEVALYKRVCPINEEAFTTAAPFEQRPQIKSEALIKAGAEKQSRIADTLAPSRILHADKVQQAKDLREHNRRVVSGLPVTDEEIAAARSQAGEKGHRTAAANRLQKRGTASDWDFPADVIPTPSAFDSLPDDDELPEAFSI